MEGTVPLSPKSGGTGTPRNRKLRLCFSQPMDNKRYTHVFKL